LRLSAFQTSHLKWLVKGEIMEEYEYTTELDDGIYGTVTVDINKVGGGTLGKSYDGLWEYRISCVDDGLLVQGSDLRTGMSHTHAEVAELACTFFDFLDFIPKGEDSV
jgi:hypothetical protein